MIEFPRIKNSATEGWSHPSSKPLALISYLMGMNSKRGDKILDGFLGSASTLIAAEQLGRICYGVELSEKFVDVAIARFKSISNAPVTIERGGEIIGYEDLRREN